MPAAKPATTSRSSSPTYTQRSGATPMRRAASSRGAGGVWRGAWCRHSQCAPAVANSGMARVRWIGKPGRFVGHHAPRERLVAIVLSARGHLQTLGPRCHARSVVDKKLFPQCRIVRACPVPPQRRRRSSPAHPHQPWGGTGQRGREGRPRARRIWSAAAPRSGALSISVPSRSNSTAAI
jgi:hypothetical protein